MFRQSVQVEQRPQSENMLSVFEKQQGGQAPTMSGERVSGEKDREMRERVGG